MKKHKILLITLVYWIGAGLAPVTCVLFEFGFELGFDYAKFYSPLFFYPLMFGVFSVYFSSRTILFFLALPKRQRFNIPLSGILLFLLTLSVLITTVEMSGRPAIWEVKKASIEEIIAHSESSNKEIKNWQGFIEHFREHRKKEEVFGILDNVDEYRLESERLENVREEFNETIINASKDIENWSFTRYFYFISFFLQQLALLSLFFTISFISIPRFTENKDDSVLKKHFILLSISLFFGLAWLYMRPAFDLDKINLYGENLISTSAATFVIGIAYVLAMLYLSTQLWLHFKEKLQVVYNSIATIFSIGLTIFSIRPGGNLLGSDASPQNYAICMLAIIIIISPWCMAYRDKLD